MIKFNDMEKKVIVSVLYEQFGDKQEELGKCFGDVSQSTISSWIKEGKYIQQVNDMKKQYDELKKQMKELGYRPVGEPIKIDEVGPVVLTALELKK